MLLQVLRNSHRIRDMPLHAQLQGLETLQEEKGVERTKGCTGVSQRHRAGPADVGCRAKGLGVDHAVIGRLRRAQHRETLLVLCPGKLA